MKEKIEAIRNEIKNKSNLLDEYVKIYKKKKLVLKTKI